MSSQKQEKEQYSAGHRHSEVAQRRKEEERAERNHYILRETLMVSLFLVVVIIGLGEFLLPWVLQGAVPDGSYFTEPRFFTDMVLIFMVSYVVFYFIHRWEWNKAHQRTREELPPDTSNRATEDE